jgi:hypothetical protein
MEKKGRKGAIRDSGSSVRLIKRSYVIDERYVRALKILSSLTGKELTLLVNEAIGDLIGKYQPTLKFDLIEVVTLDRKGGKT